MTSMHPETRMVHGGMDGLAAAGVHVPAIDLSTTNPVNDVRTGGDSYESLAGGNSLKEGDSPVYQRLWQPGVARFESALAELENAESAVAFATGMAAMTAALLAAVEAGTPHIVAVRPLYGGSDHLLESGLLGTSVTWAEEDRIAESIREDTGLVIVETPANPSLDLVDIDAVVAAAGDVPVLVDNTFCTPVLQRPIDHGAALVLHSATKYLGGHGDAMGGIIATNTAWAIRLRQVRAITGALLHPMGAYLLDRKDDPVEALSQHLVSLGRERDRLDRQLAAVAVTITRLKAGEPLMADEMFDGFDHREYEEEVTRRWGTDAYRRSDEWWSRRSPEEQREWKARVSALSEDWIAAAEAGAGPESDRCQDLARRHVEWLRAVPGTPANDPDGDLAGYVRGLGQMYVDDPRFGANYGGAVGAELVRDSLDRWLEAHGL